MQDIKKGLAKSFAFILHTILICTSSILIHMLIRVSVMCNVISNISVAEP